MARGCDNKAERGKAGGMSDQFETRPGEQDDEEPGGPDEDRVPVLGPDEGRAPEHESTATATEAMGAPEADDGLDAEANGEPDTFFPAPPAWTATVTGVGLGLVVVQGLVLVGIFTQSTAIGRYPGDYFHKIGLFLFGYISSANGLALLVAAVLAGLPTLLGAPVSAGVGNRQRLVFGLGGLLAVLMVLGTPIAVRARIHGLELEGRPFDALARRAIATYVAGTLGTALVAVAACLGLSRASRIVTPRP